MLQVPVIIQGQKVNAIIDTASEATIISDEVYQELHTKPSKIRSFSLHGAGKEMYTKGHILEPTEFHLGLFSFRETLHVAPIQDQMLIGLDFLKRHNAKINTSTGTLVLDDKRVVFAEDYCIPEVKVAKVTVQQKVVVPPMSVLQIPCKLSEQLNDYEIAPSVEGDLLVPHSVHSQNMYPVMSFVNCTDKGLTLGKDQVVGTAIEVDQICEPVSQDTEVVQVNKVNRIPDGEQQLPDFLKDLYNRSADNLSEVERQDIEKLLIKYQRAFSTNEFDLGSFNALEHTIDTGEAAPIKQRLRRTPLCFQDEEKEHLDKMIKAGVIEPSLSEWASPPVLVRKRDGSVRWCVDYRALNKVTKKCVFPLPIVEECTDSLSGNFWFSKLDATAGYWQVPIKEEDKCKTAFLTKYGLFQFSKMSFGLCNAPSTFSRVMNLVLQGLHWQSVLAFLDDVLVLGQSFDQHLQNLSLVLERFIQYGIKLKPKKCELFRPEVEYLGRIIGRDGIRIKPEAVETMKKWDIPKSTKDVERFCGFANYHRNFIKDFALISEPLYRVTAKKKFQWGEEQQQAFEHLKEALIQAPVIMVPTANDKFILDTDASDVAIGAELLQVQDGKERTISYCSFVLTPEQRRYCTTRKELLAVVRFTRQFRHYLLGRQFEVRTDHSSLQWLMNFKNPNGQLARWLEELSQYWMVISHRPGRKHDNADALSRLPEDIRCSAYRHGIKLDDLPCGGWAYCTKRQLEWGKFISDVDEAVPLVTGSRNPETRSVFASRTSGDQPGVWVDGYSRSAILEAQGQDDDLTLLLQWLKSQESPTEKDLSLSSPTTKNYWLNRQLFVVDSDGILWRKIDGDRKVLVVPSKLQTQAIALCHEIPAAGHQGVDRTLSRCKERYHWYHMSSNVKHFVMSCSACNKNKKASKKAKGNMAQYHAGSPMERVHLDFLGPLPVTKQKNEYILMIVDQFTKWVECIPLPNQTAEETARAAVNEFFSRFGCPLQIFTDRGTNFESQLFTQLCECLKIHKARTTPFHPSSNGQVERFNRTLMDAVRCFVSKTPKKWDVYLPQLAGALRSAVNRSTGYTANMLMLGREVNTPADLMFPGPGDNTVPGIDDFVGNLLEKIKETHSLARSKLKVTQANMKRDYDLKASTRPYSVGDPVYVLDSATVKGRCKKLSPVWMGPGLIVRKLSDLVYEIKIRQRLVTINHDRLKPCLDSKLPKWIIAAKNGTGTVSKSKSEFCICRGPYDNQFMIQCEECKEWYHGKCINMTPDEAEDIDIYNCPDCQ